MQVSKWGNSLAVRLPSEVVEALRLKEGDQIEIRIANTRENLKYAVIPGGSELLIAYAGCVVRCPPVLSSIEKTPTPAKDGR